MNRLKEIALTATSCFTLLSLASLAALSAAAGAFAGDAAGEQAVGAFASDIANFVFALFLYSLCVGVSFLIFDIVRLSDFWKRALHLILNYALMTVFFLLTCGIFSAEKERRMLMLFVLSFVYVAVYFVGMLVCRGLKRLALALQETKKRHGG